MRIRGIVCDITLGAFLATLALGCDGSDVQGVKVAPEKPALDPNAKVEVPKEVTKGGGSGSSGNMKRDPGADPLAR
jgi:hypothetical protein